MYTLLLIIFIIDVILLIPVILMQSGSGAEAGMFGSSLTMGAFGAKSSEVLVNLTKWLTAIFMVSAFLLGYLKVVETKRLTPVAPTESVESGQQTGEQPATAPVETNTAGAATESTLPAQGDQQQTLPTLPTGNQSEPLQLPPMQ